MTHFLRLLAVIFIPVVVAQDSTVIPVEALNTPSIRPGKYDEVKREARQAPKGPKRIWADSYLWAKAPELKVEKWLTKKPDMKGKYVLIELWNTWCPHCDRSVPQFNKWHAKYKDELAIIFLCDESEAAVKAAKNKAKRDFYFAIDTQKRMRKALNVLGVPHAILIEPNGYVIWEGFPHLKGYELTEKTIQQALAVGRKLKAAKAAKTVSVSKVERE